MKLFGKKKEKKEEEEEEEEKQNGNWIITMAFQEAIRELKEERKINEDLQNQIRIYELQKDDKIDYKSLLDLTIKTDKKKIKKLQEEKNNYKNNFEVLQTTIENIRKMCKDKNGRVISSKEILKELGE